MFNVAAVILSYPVNLIEGLITSIVVDPINCISGDAKSIDPNIFMYVVNSFDVEYISGLGDPLSIFAVRFCRQSS